jgi:mannose-6-phosphate isomerase-like protein (cupin superfamily)
VSSTDAGQTWAETPCLRVTEQQITRVPGTVAKLATFVFVYALEGDVVIRAGTRHVELSQGRGAVVAGLSVTNGKGRLLVVGGADDELASIAGSTVRADAANHYEWGVGCGGWQLVERTRLSVRAEWMPAGTAESAHVHARALQLFYALEGRCVMSLPSDERPIASLSALLVPAGMPHQMRNPGPGTARFLVISAPAINGDRVDVDEALVGARPRGLPS